MVGATFLGGYVAGRTAGAAYLPHGIVMGVLSLLVGKLLTTATASHVAGSGPITRAALSHPGGRRSIPASSMPAAEIVARASSSVSSGG
jgi:hypothetical protein